MALKYRLTFSKEYPVKFVGHIDLVTTWTRAFRRAGIPLAYSQGFNPQAKIQVAGSLPVGTMGYAELMDIALTEPMDADEILQRVADTLPNGYGLSAVEALPEKAPGLQASLQQATYRITVETELPAETLTERIETLLAHKEIIQTRTRRRKQEQFDLRPLVFELSLIEKRGNDAILSMTLAAGQHGNVRPEAIMSALSLENEWNEAARTKLIFNI